METLNVHMNRAQLKANIVAAREMYCVWGRGTGKSEGVLAPRQLHNVHSMPRSLGINVGATFAQILVRTLPAIVKSWEKIGYRRDEHFFIGHYAPKDWNWAKPYFSPIDGKYIIHWYTGAAIQMISQDGHGMANGISADYIHGDEAKLLDYEKLKTEVIPINRGNNQFFSHLPEHHSLLFTTDRPTSAKSKWILEKKNQCDEKLVKLIIELQYKINEIQAKLHTYTASSREKMLITIHRYEKQIAQLRMKCVYYSEASSLENVHALGLDFFKQMKRNLPPFDFETSIMNREVRSMERSFYPMFDEGVHTYEEYNTSHFESVGYNFDALNTNDCRKDGDLQPDQPLDIAIDYNASINIMAIGQQRTSERFDCINCLYVLSPEILDALLKKFVEYYRFHSVKVVNYHYDHTAVGKSASSNKSYRDIVREYLKKNGWTVRERYMSQAPGHQEKHNFWNELLSEKSGKLPVFRMNRSNCAVLKKSMEDARWKQTEEAFKKDKSSERNSSVAQEHATHGSDAVDQLVWGKYKSGFTRETGEFIPNTYG